MTTRRIIATLLLLTSLTGAGALGQTIVQGVVTGGEGAPVDACVVFLLHASSSLLADHTLTDASGTYKVTAPRPGDYILEFRNINFEDTTFQVKAAEPGVKQIDVALRAKIFDLQAVEVIDRLLGIRRSGDTLFYNIHAYTDGSETVIGDLLRKLPGIDVSPSGQVNYMGKTIDALLIEGNDLTGSQHAHITRHFQSDIVDGVQILENYTGEFDTRSLSGEMERVAMNITLKKEKKGVTAGHLTGGAGYYGRYIARLNAMRTTQQQGISLFASSSNHERFPNTEEFMTSYTKKSTPVIGTTRYRFMGFTLLSDVYQDNRFTDHAIRITESNRMNPLWTRRTFVELGGGRSGSRRETSKIRFADQSTEHSFQQQTQNRLSARLEHDTRLQLSPAWKIIGKAEGRLTLPGHTLADTGFVDGLSYSLEADDRKRLFHWQAEAVSEWTLHTDHTLKFYAQHRQLRTTTERDILGEAALFAYSIPDSSGQYYTGYQDRYRQQFSSLGTEWIWAPSTTELAVFFKRSSLTESLHVTFGSGAFQEEAGFQTPVYEGGIKTSMVFHKLKVQGDISLARSDGGGPAWRVLPALKFVQGIGRRHTLSLSANRLAEAPGLFYLHALPMLLDHRTLMPYHLLSIDLIDRWESTLSFQRKPGGSDKVFISRLSATWAVRTLVTREQVEENHLLKTVGFSPPNRTFRLTVLGWHTLGKWKINYSQFALYSEGYGILSGNNTPQKNLWTRSMAGLAYTGFKGYELRVSPEIQYQQQHMGPVISDWVNPAFSISAKYKGPSWEYSLELMQSANRSLGQSQSLQVLNFSLGYRKWMPFRIYMEGADVLNLLSNQALTTMINPAFAQTILSDRIPGSILLIGRYDF